MRRSWVLAGITVFAAVVLAPLVIIVLGPERVERLVWRNTGAPIIGVRGERDIMITMADGTRLATDLYLPLLARPPLATVMMRLPYDKSDYAEVHHHARQFLRHGYAVVVQDMRGRFGSEGTFAPYEGDADDAAATLEWIAAQPWSNGKVGTIGCSALGETQVILAAKRHPAHAAMIPIGAGGAVGSLGEAHSYFAFFEGGVLNLSSAFGWFARWGGKTSDYMSAPDIDYAAAVRGLPILSLVAGYRDDPTDYEELITHFADSTFMKNWGYITQDDSFATPALMVDTWYDTAISATLKLSEHMMRSAPGQHVVIAPGTHCDFRGTSGWVGEMPYAQTAALDFDTIFLAFFDHHLRGAKDIDLAPYTYFVLGEDRWREAKSWPPENTVLTQFPLATSSGDVVAGRIGWPDEMPRKGSLRFVADPMNPVPSIGGATCCTNDPAALVGPAYQNAIEARGDVITFTSETLTKPLLIAGPLSAVLHVSTDAPDADLVARLTDVDAQGHSILIQEGAQRLRYRNGFGTANLMQEGRIEEVEIRMRDIAYLVQPGHRLRLTISASSFPRLERNMQTGGLNYDETTGQIADIGIYTGSGTLSRLRLFTLPLD
jgi:uncharacterized protein